MKSKIIHGTSVFAEILIISMWTYTGLIKILNFSKWQFLFGNIPFIADYDLEFFIYVLPAIELCIPLLFIISNSTKKIGAILSSLLLVVFNIYIFHKLYISDVTPCACGGVFEKLSLQNHIFVNGIFILLSIFIFLTSRNHLNKNTSDKSTIQL